MLWLYNSAQIFVSGAIVNAEWKYFASEAGEGCAKRYVPLTRS